MKKRHGNPLYAYSRRVMAVMVPGANGTQTPVCPSGTERCGDALPGHPPPCCKILTQGPTPTSARRRRMAMAGI